MVHLVYSRMESLVFFQTFKPIDDICVVCPTTIVTPTSLCMHSQKLSTNIFHYVIIKKYIFKIILFDYKLNNILNKQSLLFQTLSSNGYLNNFLIPKFLSQNLMIIFNNKYKIFDVDWMRCCCQMTSAYSSPLIQLPIYRDFSLEAQVLSQTPTFQKNFLYLLQWQSFKNNEKCFLFHFKNSFCSHDI